MHIRGTPKLITKLEATKIHHNVCIINLTSPIRHDHMFIEFMESTKHINNAQPMILESKYQHKSLLEFPVKQAFQAILHK